MKDPDGFDLQISNGNGLAKTPQDGAGDREAVGAGAVRVDRLEDRVARSLLVQRDELQGERVVLHQPARLEPTYDEGSQNELLIGDVGDIIIRGGNPLDPGLRQGAARAARARASITSRSASRRGTPTA